jgi:hypothetical protein
VQPRPHRLLRQLQEAPRIARRHRLRPRGPPPGGAPGRRRRRLRARLRRLDVDVLRERLERLDEAAVRLDLRDAGELVMFVVNSRVTSITAALSGPHASMLNAAMIGPTFIALTAW